MFCIHCGKQIEDDALFCPECGLKQEPAEEAAPAAETAAAVLPEEPKTAEEKPEAEQTGEAQEEPVPDDAVQEENTPEAEVVQEQPTDVPTQPYGAPAPVWQQTVAVAAPPSKKGKKKFVIIAAILVVVLAIAGVATWLVLDAQAKEQARIEAHESYVADANSFSTRLLSTAVDLEEVGKEIYSCWYDYVYNSRYSSPSEAVKMALLLKATKVSDAKSSQLILKQLYDKLISVPDEANEDQLAIREQVKKTYDAFMTFYDFVMEPTGSYSSFKSTYNDADEKMADEYKELKSLLDGLE